MTRSGGTTLQQSPAVLLDTNILLLFVVGTIDVALIGRFKRTADRFDACDYDTLLHFLEPARQLLTTAHVLTEASNLLGQLRQRPAAQRALHLASIIQRLDEPMIPAKSLTNSPAFARFGLTDAAIDALAHQGVVVLSDDGPLVAWLLRAGHKAFNFNQLRDL